MSMEPIVNTTGTTAKNSLSSEVKIKGNLEFTGELAFDGKLDGEISSEGTLLLGDSAVINGNLNVGSVVVRGKVNGNITAKDKIEMKATAKVHGDISAKRLSVEDGVTFIGKSEVNPAGAGAPAAAAPAAAAPEQPPKQEGSGFFGRR